MAAVNSASSPGRAIRLAILDDNPFVRLPDGEVRPRAALFHRFAEAVVAAGPFEPARYLIPVTELAPDAPAPSLGAIDPRRLTVVPTSAFAGIAGYLRSWPAIARRNWPILRGAIATADLLWIKAPASNAMLGTILARRARVPYFTWVAGSARAVVQGQRRSGPAAVGASLVAAAYDSITGVLTSTGPAIRLDSDVHTTVVTADEVAETRRRRKASTKGGSLPSRQRRPLELVWAGRIVADKGLDDLIEAMDHLREVGRPSHLTVIGDGPERGSLERGAAARGLGAAIRWIGYVGDRGAYFEHLRATDLFVLPSRAEGVPKVVVEAMAAGLPVVATRVGGVPALLAEGRRGRLVRPGRPDELAAAISELATDDVARRELAEAGLDYVAVHTLEAQAGRLVEWLRATFPRLPWPETLAG
jgi:hypothetical protein